MISIQMKTIESLRLDLIGNNQSPSYQNNIFPCTWNALNSSSIQQRE